MSDRLSRAVEGQISAAQRRGEFDDLPGAGKPLDLGDTNDPEWWIKNLIKRENLDLTGAMTPSLVLRREAASYPGSLVDVPREETVRAILADYNRRVLDDRRRPVVGPSPPVAPTVDVDDLVTQWRALRAEHQRELAVTRSATTPADPRPDSPARRRWWRRRR